MTIDPVACAFGTFQVVFADVTERLATAVLSLRLRRKEVANFEEIFKPGFDSIVKEFKAELKILSSSEFNRTDVEAVRQLVIGELGELNRWRNDRIHARVRQMDGQYALFDWRTKGRLTMTVADCEGMIERVVRVISNLEAYMPGLLDGEELEKALDKILESRQASPP